MEASRPELLNRIVLFKSSWIEPKAGHLQLPLSPFEAGRITAATVNVRSGPGTDYESKRILEKNDIVPVKSRIGDWFEIGTDEWIPLNYVKIDFAAKVERMEKEREIVVADDLQKSRWGGNASINGWELDAAVTKKKLPNVYRVILTLTNHNKQGGRAAFLLHDSFNNRIRYEPVLKGKAQIEVTAYEAFTVGAYTEDDTMLELDLNEQTGYPKGFYYRDVSEKFKQEVESLYKAKPVLVKNDPQKNRWGGKSLNNGKQLTAEVKKSIFPRNYDVEITVKPENPDTMFNQDVAFFLHDSFLRAIRYKKATEGRAKITVTAYEDFTVGAYTADGTLLELDLHEVKGYPDRFYAKD